MSAKALLEYFKPLHVFLIDEIKRLKDKTLRPILSEYNNLAALQCNKLQLAEWAKITDVNNEDKSKAYTKAINEHAKFVKDQYSQHFSGLKSSDFSDEQIQRQIKILTNIGVNALNESRLAELTETKVKLEKIYNNAEFCDFYEPNCTNKLTLEPEMKEIMANSVDFDRLKYIWLMWHNSTGPHMRSHYKKYIDISNEAAKLNNFTDYGDMWRSSYEDPNFMDNLEKLWHKVQPLYDALHEYTRHKLIQIYGSQMDESDPLIPAHLLGNMWAQSWVNLYDRIKPFNTSSEININIALHVKKIIRNFACEDGFIKSDFILWFNRKTITLR